VPGIDGVALNERVLVLTIGVTVLAGVVFGLAPTLQASRPDLTGALSEGGRGGESRRGGRLRRSLVATEIGLSVVLLVSATLLVKAYVQTRSNDVGYRIDDLVAMRVQLPDTKYGNDEAVVSFQRRLLERLRALPGVVSAGASHTLPMRSNNATTYGIVGEEVPTEGREPAVSFRIVTPGYVEAMGMALVEGRLFDDDDVEAAPRVLLVNERFAAQHWGEDSPLGQRVRLGEEEWEVVGVVGDTRDWGPDSTPGRMVYLPAWQTPQRGMNLAVHTGADPAGLIASVRETVRGMDPDQPIYDAATMTEITREQMSGNMAMVKVLGVLALVAFVLSAVGVYGVMAYSVARRTREMGVRVALGATAVDVRGLVVRQGLVLASFGIAGGALVALGAARGLSFFLFGLSPYDPVAYATVIGVLLVTAVAASWVPAVRATRVDPVQVLSA
jgi:predicted permease